jgi:hypothetical protein
MLFKSFVDKHEANLREDATEMQRMPTAQIVQKDGWSKSDLREEAYFTAEEDPEVDQAHESHAMKAASEKKETIQLTPLKTKSLVDYPDDEDELIVKKGSSKPPRLSINLSSGKPKDAKGLVTAEAPLEFVKSTIDPKPLEFVRSSLSHHAPMEVESPEEHLVKKQRKL